MDEGKRKIDFVLRGRVEGVEITPATIGLSRFNEFNRQAEEFISGSEKQKLDEVTVEIEKGSYRFRTLVPILTAAAGLAGDLKALERQDSLGEIDPKRAKVIASWQAKAKANPEIRFTISPEEGAKPLEISADSDYRIGEVEPWVTVEKYLYGRIEDMGGAKNPNVHLRTEDSAKLLTIGSSVQYLRKQRTNRLYHQALLRVEAKQHFKTGELRDIRLISFEDYKPSYDEEALDRFAEEGRVAWADVENASDWVEALRGGGG